MFEFFLLSLFPSSSSETSLSHYYSIDYKQSRSTYHLHHWKKLLQERKRNGDDDDLYNTPSLKKTKKKDKKRTRHTSASSTIVIISVDCNDTYTNKTMTWTFSYISGATKQHRWVKKRSVQALHALLSSCVQQICARLVKKKRDIWRRRMTRDSVGIHITAVTHDWLLYSK